MAVTGFWFARGIQNLLDRTKAIDVDTNTLKIMLTTSSWTPNQDTMEVKSDVTNEVVGTGYTAGGATLASVTITQTLNVVTLDAADAAWTVATITARRAVIYDSTAAADADKALICWIDFGQNEVSSGGTFTVQFAAGGIASATAADATGFP